MALVRGFNLSLPSLINISARCIVSKTPPKKMTLDLRRALLDDADPHYRTRIHDSTYEVCSNYHLLNFFQIAFDSFLAEI